MKENSEIFQVSSMPVFGGLEPLEVADDGDAVLLA
jgi:hypothetical protein